MMKLLYPLLLIVLLFGCSQDKPKGQTNQPARTTASVSNQQMADHLLVFFLDPNGGPCRMQGDILSRMTNELEGKVLVRPVQTTIAADRDLFYAYGIRALPTILLADSTGKELKRLPPGVQGEEAIRSLLSQVQVN